MKILLYSPDNGVSRNFVPHLWMFLLQALTPQGHEVILVDGNARAMSEDTLVRFVREQGVGLVGIGAMTRMIARAYRMADAVRAAGVPVVLGGPHVSEVPDEALGRDGGPRHADAVAIGEADKTWPLIVEDAAAGRLKDVYQQETDIGDGNGKPESGANSGTGSSETSAVSRDGSSESGAHGGNGKPALQPYPVIPWETLDLQQFNHIPTFMRPLMKRLGGGWRTFHIIPIETGRGCPYGCEFCTVTGFFGDSLRFRTNESVVDELLRLKARARREQGQIAVFFVDDNLAVNIKRTKSLLRDIIAAEAQLFWVAQISANLLRDNELIDLIAESGGKWIFIGMESIDPANLADVNKGFSHPDEYAAVLDRLAQRDVYAITSFIFGMDNDTPGVAERTLQQIRRWPPVLPVFGQLTPFPGTPLHSRLLKAGRLDRPKHWMDFAPFEMAHKPLKMTIPEVRREVNHAWSSSYSPEANALAINSISHKHIGYRISHIAARIVFRGIYFPQVSRWRWMKVIVQNRRTIYNILREGLTARGKIAL